MGVIGATMFWMLRLIGGPPTFLFAITFLMIQVASSTAVVPFDAMPYFYRIGLGLPFMNLVACSRSIVLRSNTDYFSRCLGILFVWIGFWISLLVIDVMNAKKHITDMFK